MNATDKQAVIDHINACHRLYEKACFLGDYEEAEAILDEIEQANASLE